MNEYQLIIQQNIKRLIQLKGLKQRVVAERAGFKEAEFSNMVNGRKIIKAEYIPSIAKALESSFNEIYKTDGE